MTRKKKNIITVAIAWLCILPFVVYWLYYMMNECSPKEWQREYWEGLATIVLCLSAGGLILSVFYAVEGD